MTREVCAEALGTPESQRTSAPSASASTYERLMVRFPGAWRALAKRLLRLISATLSCLTSLRCRFAR